MPRLFALDCLYRFGIDEKRTNGHVVRIRNPFYRRCRQAAVRKSRGCVVSLCDATMETDFRLRVHPRSINLFLDSRKYMAYMSKSSVVYTLLLWGLSGTVSTNRFSRRLVVGERCFETIAKRLGRWRRAGARQVSSNNRFRSPKGMFACPR
jgi:hypothetical protein